jgi:class 3 adenylate cyclase
LSGSSLVERPQTRYATSGDVHVAYQVLGSGPVDLVYIQGAFTNLDSMWELPAFRRFCERLAGFSRVIWFDKRGMGLSDRVEAGTLDDRMDDVRAVMDAAGSQRAVLLGESEGGPLSLLFAAAHPERTMALILCGAEVRERKDDEWPWGESSAEEFEQAMATIADWWGEGRVLSRLAPGLSGDPAAVEWMGRMLRNAASPRAAETFMRMAFTIDVRHVVPSIRVPALVVHRTDDAMINVGQARFLASHLPEARLVELPGSAHAPWGDGDDVIAEIREFLTGVREPPEPERVLATVLFTDIVGSTELLRHLGDRSWAHLLEEHHRVVRSELTRHRGREVDTAGDGFLAIFDGPGRALRAALAVVEAVRPLGIEVRAGVHTGECEVFGDKVVGVAVHLAARVVAKAGPSEVLATRTVKDLVSGSDVAFESRGLHRLKGIADRWQLYLVTAA